MKRHGNQTAFLAAESGYTIVEVLVALALLSVALVPITQFAARLISNADTRDLIVATDLARSEMEYVVSKRDFYLGSTEVRKNHKTWKVETKIRKRDGLITIHILVYRKGKAGPVAELRTLRLAEP